jgi:solute carrier family 25 oxoglutarate transporter 11
MVVNGAQFSTYSQAKEYFLLKNYCNEGVLLHFYASLASGFVTTITSLPVDIVKTRIQNMKKSVNNQKISAWVSDFLLNSENF